MISDKYEHASPHTKIALGLSGLYEPVAVVDEDALTYRTWEDDVDARHDAVNHPKHYTSGPLHSVCGKPIECIDITREMGFDLGNAMKYIWRADLKNDAIEDLKKAAWYINDEIARRESEQARQ